MEQPKKLLTKICLNNWGGIDHEVLYLNENINLFSGKSGSGKSTVMDAIQVVLYGSFQQGFLNKAADDSKNRRSVFSYLRGAQKDGSYNRGNRDFCSMISMELVDTATKEHACVGVYFEVKNSDTELKKYGFFSHAGVMPDKHYITEEGYPFSAKEVRGLLKERTAQKMSFNRADINRVYPSAESYRRVLYDVVLGGIDGNRFMTMEKSAIALKMSNGTGSFIRDYMFPKSSLKAIERLSEQLGAYRDIKEKVDDLRSRIELLTAIQNSWKENTKVKMDLQFCNDVLRVLELQELEQKIQARKVQVSELEEELGKLATERKTLQERYQEKEQALIQVKADLKSGDLGSKEDKLSELEKHGETLAMESKHFRKILDGLSSWKENETACDYMSNDFLNALDDFIGGNISVQSCEALKEQIANEKVHLEEQIEEDQQKRRELLQSISEKEHRIEDMRDNKKTYPSELKEARRFLKNRLKDKFGHTVPVYIFADLFDVKDTVWKNAIEGRLGRIKYSMITEPEYAKEAAETFQRMKKYENVELINTNALSAKEITPQENSLYEAVTTKYDFADQALKRYLGGIIKCQSVEDLVQTRDGVTPDCYSYGNFVFRHLREKDYTKFACIGSKVSKENLVKDQIALEKEKEQLQNISDEWAALKETREYESLKEMPDYLMSLYQAGKELEQIRVQKEALQKEIQELRAGTYHELEEKESRLTAEAKELQENLERLRSKESNCNVRKGSLLEELSQKEQLVHTKKSYFTPSDKVQKFMKEAEKEQSLSTVRSKMMRESSQKEELLAAAKEQLGKTRLAFNTAYPAFGLIGTEETNDSYDELLDNYKKNYEPKYEEEFEKQCRFVYRSLRDNVIAAIHGDIKAAKRHEHEINHLLRQTNFSDSTYQIEIAPAENEMGQFYDMLMAQELDEKSMNNNGYEGQISLGDDAFYEKYESQITLLTEKFMPVTSNAEEEGILQKWHSEMEKYADYRNYLSFHMYERVVDERTGEVRKNYVDEMAGRDSGGEGQNPKYVALLTGFAMLYMLQADKMAKFRLVLLDEAFSKMDQERSAVCLQYARMMGLQMIVCVPDERLQSLIQNVDAVYGFRRYQNKISLMHIDKGNYLNIMTEGSAVSGDKQN